MLQRCYNPNDLGFKEYGNRGILVEDFLHLSKNFIEWAFNNGYKVGLSLDRINNNKGYFRENLRWVTQAEQNRNKRNNVKVVWNNTEMCFTDFVQQHTNVSVTYARKLYISGKTLEEIASITPKARGRRAEGIRLGKLRPNESIYGKRFNSP